MGNALPYHEGTLFAVPLRTGGYGLGIIARLSGNGVAFGYFFGPHRKSVPSVSEVQHLLPDESILRIKFGDLGLMNGEWPTIGHLAGFKRNVWQMPPLIRVDDTSNNAWKEWYTDDLEIISEEPCNLELSEEYPKSILAGYGAVEKRLTRLIASSS
jgi:hypothetical protein